MLDFDPRLPAFRADPHPTLRALRERAPVFHSPLVNAWIVTRYADVHRVATDTVHFSNDLLAPLVGRRAAAMGPERERHRIGTTLAMADGDVHARLRGLVSPFFTPNAVSRLESGLQRFVDARLAAARARGGMDVIGDLARPLAEEAIATILGVPHALRRPLHAWAAATTRVADPLLGRDERRANFLALSELADYLDELVAYRRHLPADDLLSRLVAAEPERISHGEILATCMAILGGGIETVSMAIGKGLLALLDHPGELARLCAEPEIARNATEELLRFAAPAVFAPRAAVADLALGEATIRAGDVVLYSPAAACRDPAVFADPDRLDLGRDFERGPSLAFGYGAHYCLGAALARLECRIAWQRLAGLPHLTLAKPRAELAYGRNLMSMSLESLPVSV